MGDTQLLTIALAAGPTMLAVLVGILINNSRLSDLRGHMDARFNVVDGRFDEMRDRWRVELHRVESAGRAAQTHRRVRSQLTFLPFRTPVLAL